MMAGHVIVAIMKIKRNSSSHLSLLVGFAKCSQDMGKTAGAKYIAFNLDDLGRQMFYPQKYGLN